MRDLSPVFEGTMDAKRRIVLDDQNAWVIWRCHFKKDDRVQLTLKKKTKKRTNSQNKYYWKICQLIANESGYETAEEVHDALKFEYLRVHREKLPDTVRSTTDLTTAEFAGYIDAIKRDASQGKFGGGDGGIYIPDAGQFE